MKGRWNVVREALADYLVRTLWQIVRHARQEARRRLTVSQGRSLGWNTPDGEPQATGLLSSLRGFGRDWGFGP